MSGTATSIWKDETLWAWATREDAEEWAGPFKTREDAEAALRAIADGDSINGIVGFVAEAHYADPAKVIQGLFDVEDVLERMEESEDELSCHEDGCFVVDSPGTRGAADEALDDALAAWAEKYVRVERWNVTGEAFPVGIAQ